MPTDAASVCRASVQVKPNRLHLRDSWSFWDLVRSASEGCSAAGRVIARLVAICLIVPLGCAPVGPPGTRTGGLPTRPGEARACAWFGDARDGVLYFGESSFWSAWQASHGDPLAAVARQGPQRIGRFDLTHEQLLPALVVEPLATASGTWDVLAHPNGRVYYTDLFGSSGWIDPATGRRGQLGSGPGLNELALGSGGRVLATRYGGFGESPGAVVVLDPDGAVLAEHGLEAEPPGVRPAAKSLAFDPIRDAVWVNTDLLDAGGRAAGHDARVLDLATGRWTARFPAPELQFVRFEPDGRGLFVWLEGTRLVLRDVDPGGALGPDSGRPRLLDPAFPGGLDFVQDVVTAPDGSVVAMRWSGLVHVVSRAGDVRTTRLPRPAPGGLFYTAVPHDGRLCATYCGGITVVCAPAP
jgi:hypothetical protein